MERKCNVSIWRDKLQRPGRSEGDPGSDTHRGSGPGLIARYIQSNTELARQLSHYLITVYYPFVWVIPARYCILLVMMYVLYLYTPGQQVKGNVFEYSTDSF